jgi:hypothetical protein
MCVVYSNYGIIFFENLKFSKDASLIFETLNVFCEKNGLRKTELFRFVKVLYYILCQEIKTNTIY